MTNQHSGTLIETDEDIVRSLRQHVQNESELQSDVAVSSSPKLDRRTIAFRPTHRPPVPLLTVFDDGQQDGEQIRIRGSRFIIGRTQGDLRIPLDRRVSSRHVQITHHLVQGQHRWVVTDLQSRHGLFVRVSRAALTDQCEILVGQGRFRFEAAKSESANGDRVQVSAEADEETHGWQDRESDDCPAVLTEILGKSIGNRLLLVKPEYWIGADPACGISRPDDPFCEPRHARIYYAPKTRWQAEHNNSQNGLWLRMPQVIVESSIQFQLGEQRFRLRVH